MRLVKTEIDRSLIVKLDRSILSSKDKVNGFMRFGSNNDYPQVIERLINNSVTAKAAARIYAKFLTGDGFNNSVINSVVIGKDHRGKDITVRNLLSQIAISLSKHFGFYIHCNINLEGIIGNVKFVPFKYCRFAKIDEQGYTAKIGVYDNWDKDYQQGKNFNINNIVWFNIYNLDPKVIASQMKANGGKDKFKGQVFFHFFDNEYLYPLSPFDPVYMDTDTEYQIQLFKNRTIRNGLLDKTIFRVASPSNDEERAELKKSIESFIGPDGPSVLTLEDDIDPQTGEIKSSGAFKADSIKSNINDKLFENWEKNLANNIRKSMAAIPDILIDYEESKLGTTSGEAIIQATNFYNAITQDDRAQIEEVFKEIFSNFNNDILKQNQDWQIKPLNLYDNGVTSVVGTAAGN